jgi:hypothetical protein
MEAFISAPATFFEYRRSICWDRDYLGCTFCLSLFLMPFVMYLLLFCSVLFCNFFYLYMTCMCSPINVYSFFLSFLIFSYLERILETQPCDTRSWRLMSHGLTPLWASSTILCLTTSGRGRPFTNTPPSWFTPPWPGIWHHVSRRTKRRKNCRHNGNIMRE